MGLKQREGNRNGATEERNKRKELGGGEGEVNVSEAREKRKGLKRGQKNRKLKESKKYNEDSMGGERWGGYHQ